MALWHEHGKELITQVNSFKDQEIPNDNETSNKITSSCSR